MSQALAQRHGRSGKSTIAQLERGGPDQLFPVSAGQHRLWFLDQLQPFSTAYLIPAAVELEGPLDPVALAESLSRLVARHESLRTTFRATGGRPAACVGPAAPVDLALCDLSEHLPERIASIVDGMRRAEAGRPLDLSHGPLLRAGLLRVAAARHVLLLTLHHIAVDGWSLATLLGELASLYRQTTTGEPAHLPELPVQYVDFAAWQQEWLRGAESQRQFGYWRRQLRYAPQLNLPADHVDSPADAAGRAGALPVSWPQPLMEALRDLAKQQRATVFMALLAGVAITLSRWGGQTDVIVGTPVAGRQLPELEPVVGFFANTLPLRVSVDGMATFRETLEAARQTCLAGFAHQDVPYQKVVEALQPDRRSAPLIKVMLALGDVPVHASLVPGLSLRVLEPTVTAAKFDLTWEVAPDSTGGLAGRLEYDATLYRPATIERLHDYLSTLLTAVVKDPDRPLATLPLPRVPVPLEVDAPAKPVPRPAPAAALTLSGPVEPRDAVEGLLARVWADVLEVDRVGVLDDFFALGGHSLLVTAAVAQVQEALGMPVPLDGALGATTIREFAQYLREVGDEAGVDVTDRAQSAGYGATGATAAGPRALDRRPLRAG
ncbi:MAG TPA: condensation domain-containing protein [Candidatus Limnocylindrales bacterium]|nr:condensation domain-containing protein [Candidatus Limnocylindrales bacterium]